MLTFKLFSVHSKFKIYNSKFLKYEKYNIFIRNFI